MSACAGSAPQFGARIIDGEAVFNVWAPAAGALFLELAGETPRPMQARPGGWFSLRIPAPAERRYRYRMPDGAVFPDPASRAQQGGPHGYSLLQGPPAFAWRHGDWRGRPWREMVFYEIHPGLAGGFAGVAALLPRLASLGVTALELMPVAEFPGARSWGYDGVLPFAPAAAYGAPDDLRRLVDEAHGLGVSVFLDVVFNHFGPVGNCLHLYAPQFFHAERQTPWGAGIDFDRPEVRQFFIECALSWLEDYRMDGLRLDAVHAIPAPGFLRQLNDAVRERSPGRERHLVIENEHNDPGLLEFFDAQWNDDFHHAVHVLLTGETGSYYAAFADDPARHLARVLAEGFAFQGEPVAGMGRRRGGPGGRLSPLRFVNFIQNHDQTGNRAFGERLQALADPQAVAAAVALTLLSPPPPMLFMGEEDGSRTPFFYFTDHDEELAAAVREGRRREFQLDGDPCGEPPPDPNDPATFVASRPRPGPDAAAWRALYKTLIDVRRRLLTPALEQCASAGAEALGPGAVTGRWRLGEGIWSIYANFSAEAVRAPAPQGQLVLALGEGAETGEGLVIGPRSFRAYLAQRSSQATS